MTIRRVLCGSWILGALLLAGPMWADAPEEVVDAPDVAAESCDAWFPDINCGRSGRWEGFRMPIAQFALFEDPFVTTGVYGWYAYHEFPERSALQGGHLHDVSLQLRVALTDRIAIIATKDGYVWNRPDNPLLDDTQGWLNIAGGLKVVLYEDKEMPFILSGILRYESDSGSTDTLQGHGDGQILPSISMAYAWDDFHFIADLGGAVPIDSEQSSFVFNHIYADYALTPTISPFIQTSWIRWVDSGDGSIPVPLNIGVDLPLDTVQAVLGTGAFEGADLLNLGSRGVDDLDLWTLAIGSHFAITDHITFSVAYERPFSHHKGIFKQRVTTNLSYEF